MDNDDIEEFLRMTGVSIEEEDNSSSSVIESVDNSNVRTIPIQNEQKTILDNKFIFKDLIEEKKVLLIEIKNLLELMNRDTGLNNTSKGINKDLIEKVDKLENLLNNLVNFFHNPPTKEEIELINKSMILNKSIEDFKKFEEILNNINLNQRMESFSLEFNDFTEKIESKLSLSAKKYDEFLSNFLSSQESKADLYFQKISKIFNVSNNKINSLILITLSIGIVIGLIFIINLQKPYSYNKNIDIKETNEGTIIEVPKSSEFIIKDNKKIILVK